MALLFDKNGNLIRDKVKYKAKHSELIKDVINELPNKFFCSKCNNYHKKKYRGKLSQVYIKHNKFSIKVSDSFLYNWKMNKSFDNYSIDKHIKTVGSRKQ